MDRNKPIAPPLLAATGRAPAAVALPAAAAGKPKERLEPDMGIWSKSHGSRSPVTVVLNNGKEFTGPVRAFGRYTVVIETQDGPRLVFKTAMAYSWIEE